MRSRAGPGIHSALSEARGPALMSPRAGPQIRRHPPRCSDDRDTAITYEIYCVPETNTPQLFNRNAAFANT